MKKTLTIAAVALAAAAVTTQAGITVDAGQINSATDLSWSGNWTPLTADTASTIAASPWNAKLMVDNVDVLGVFLNVLRVEGEHTPAALLFNASVGLPDGAINVGQVATQNASLAHAGGTDDWQLKATLVAPSEIKWEVTAKHVVPEPSTYAMLAGLGLAGFALYRRMKA